MKVYATENQTNKIQNVFNGNTPIRFVRSRKQADLFLDYARADNFGRKDRLQALRGLEFVPPTLFSKELVPAERKAREYYLKEVDVENGSGVLVLPPDRLPKVVPKGHVLQRGIFSALLDRHKYDLRVLCCVRRALPNKPGKASVLVLHNIIYRVNPNPLTKPHKAKHQLCNTTYNRHSKVLLSFCASDKTKRMTEHESYIQQLCRMIPQIYKRLLPRSNSLLADELKTLGKSLEDCFLFNGLDFIPDTHHNLFFLEVNTSPGWKSWWQKDYQEIYKAAFRFMQGQEVPSEMGTVVEFDL